MNSEENNERLIAKLERMEKIYSDEKKHESVMSRIDDEDTDICYTARRFFKWALLVTWLACAFTLVSGGDFSLPAAAILITAGMYSGLCVTKFLNEKKTWDAVVAGVIAAAAIALGILLLVSNNPY